MQLQLVGSSVTAAAADAAAAAQVGSLSHPLGVVVSDP